MEHLEAIGKVAGIGGIALGVLLLVFRETVTPHIAKLTRTQAHGLLRTMVFLAFFAALCGIGAWVWVETRSIAVVAGDDNRADCSVESSASRSNVAATTPGGVIDAGGSVRAGGDIRVTGAADLERPGVTADCGDVTAGGAIHIEADSETGNASAPGQ